MFARYAATVKNLRGVILFENPSSNTIEIINWISKRFKYRDIGIPYDLYSEMPKEIRRKFIELYYPSKELEITEKILTKIYDFDIKLSRSLVLSSIYIAPLFNISYSYENDISKISICNVYVKDSLDEKSWKLHFRISDYSILDFYKQAVDESMDIIKLLNRGSLNDEYVKRVITEREKRIYKDINRYWRVKSEKGIKFLSYIDNLKLILDGISSGIININDLNMDFAAAFSIVPMIWLNKDTIKHISK